jgi:MFS family permease
MLFELSRIAYAIGAAIGPVVAGRAFDRAGAYRRSFITVLSLCCLAGALFTLFPPRNATRPPAETSLDILVNPLGLTDSSASLPAVIFR